MREATAQSVHALAAWAAAIPPERVPDQVLQRAARVLADDLSAIVGARDEPEVKAFHSKILERAKDAEATVFRGGRPRTDRFSAAVANGLAGDWIELDEGYRQVPCHAGLYVVPALLAEAEARDLSFAELLRAIALGYEIVTRVALAWSPKALNQQSHGRYAAIGAAAAVSLAQGKPSANLAAAIGAAATLIGPSPRNHVVEGVLIRNAWPAWGAWSGMMAVEWMECGIAGTPAALYDAFTTILGGEAHPERLTGGLGEQWGILDGYTKVYACCQHLHSAVEAAIGLRPKLLQASALEDVERIEVETHALALPLVNARPPTSLAAKFSMSHAMAAALAKGSGGADAFAAATLTQPDIARLRERVSVKPWQPELPPPNDRPARVTLTLRDGRKLSEECMSARGGADRPLPSETVLEKMDALAAPAYPGMRRVFEQLLSLEPRRMKQGWRTIADEMCGSA